MKLYRKNDEMVCGNTMREGQSIFAKNWESGEYCVKQKKKNDLNFSFSLLSQTGKLQDIIW